MAQVLITGGSTGIGYELARCFCRDGNHVAINGANETRLLAAKAKLEQEFGCTIDAFVQDLSVCGGTRALYDTTKKAGLVVDILINNAGMGLTASTEEIDFDADNTLMQLNMMAQVQLCKLYLPEMYKRKSGKILNVASVAAYQPGPYNSTYFASKAFVLSYSRAIRYEAKEHGVDVCTLCPGSTITPFFEKEGLKAPPMSNTPDIVAAYAYKHFLKSKEIIIPGVMNQISRWIPSGLKVSLVAKMKDLDKA